MCPLVEQKQSVMHGPHDGLSLDHWAWIIIWAYIIIYQFLIQLFHFFNALVTTHPNQ